MQDQAHSFSMVFFVLTFRTLCSRGYRMAQSGAPWKSVCSDTYTHCTKMAQATVGFVLKAFGHYPSGERLVDGSSVVIPVGVICCLVLFLIKQLCGFEGCMFPLVCAAPLMENYSKLKLMCEKFCNKSAVFRQQSALLTFWKSRKHPHELSLVNHLSCIKVACNGMADSVLMLYLQRSLFAYYMWPI